MNVFREGKWIQYPLELIHIQEQIPGWKQKHTFQASSMYASAITRGYTPIESTTFAEMYVFKQIYEGITYDSKRENQMKDLLC